MCHGGPSLANYVGGPFNELHQRGWSNFGKNLGGLSSPRALLRLLHHHSAVVAVDAQTVEELLDGEERGGNGTIL